MLAEFVTFTLGMTFASTTIVLPQLVGELTDSTVAVGLVVTVSSGAWLIPQLPFERTGHGD